MGGQRREARPSPSQWSTWRGRRRGRSDALPTFGQERVDDRLGSRRGRWSPARHRSGGGSERPRNSSGDDNVTARSVFAEDGFPVLSTTLWEAFEDSVERDPRFIRSEEPTSELQYLMRISYAVFC